MSQSSQSSLASGVDTVVSREDIKTAWVSYQEAVKEEAETYDGERETLGILTNQALQGAMRPKDVSRQPWWRDRIRDRAAIKPVINLLELILSHGESSSHVRVSQQARPSSNDADGDGVRTDRGFEPLRQKTEDLPPLEGSPTIELKRLCSVDTALSKSEYL